MDGYFPPARWQDRELRPLTRRERVGWGVVVVSLVLVAVALCADLASR